jgi:hypothetical protein
MYPKLVMTLLAPAVTQTMALQVILHKTNAAQHFWAGNFPQRNWKTAADNG